MIEKYRISVIIPIYNMERFLDKCINSVLNQTYRNLEIILVDDGSVDQSAHMCDDYALRDNRIRVIHKQNGGLVSAWKAGVEASKENYLFFVDSDDWIDLCTIEELASNLTGNEREIVSCDGIIEHENGTSDYTWQVVSPGEYDSERIREEIIPNILGNEQRFIHVSRCLKLISRSIFVNNMKYADEKLVMGEDFSVMVPTYMDCERFVLLDHKAYYHYRYVDSSMVHRYDKRLKDNIELLHEIGLRIIDDKYSGEIHQEMFEKMEREYIYLLFLVLKNEARGNSSFYAQNIREIARNPKISEIVRKYPIETREFSNKLIYFVLKHPNRIAIESLKWSFKWYYREKKNAS